MFVALKLFFFFFYCKFCLQDHKDTTDVEVAVRKVNEGYSSVIPHFLLPEGADRPTELSCKKRKLPAAVKQEKKTASIILPLYNINCHGKNVLSCKELLIFTDDKCRC